MFRTRNFRSKFERYCRIVHKAIQEVPRHDPSRRLGTTLNVREWVCQHGYHSLFRRSVRTAISFHLHPGKSYSAYTKYLFIFLLLLLVVVIPNAPAYGSLLCHALFASNTPVESSVAIVGSAISCRKILISLQARSQARNPVPTCRYRSRYGAACIPRSVVLWKCPKIERL